MELLLTGLSEDHDYTTKSHPTSYSNEKSAASVPLAIQRPETLE